MPKDSVKVNFQGGLDLKNDPWQIPAGDFLALNNMVFTTGGRLTKRNAFAGGFTTTVNAPNPTLTYSVVPSTLAAGRKVFAYNNELCLLDGFNLYSYDFSASAWNYKGRNTSVNISTSTVVSNANTYLECDLSVDTTTGVKVFTYASANGVFYSIQDTASEQFLVNQALFGTNYTNPRCISISGKSWIFAVNTSDHKLYYLPIVGGAVSGSLTALITNLNTSEAFYDVDVDSFTGNIYIAYFNSSPGLEIAALTTSMTVGSSISISTEIATNGISWFGDGTNIWVPYNNGSSTKVFIVNNAVTATVLGPTVVASASSVNNVTGVWWPAQSKAFIFSDPTTRSGGFTTSAAIYFNTMTVGGTAGTSTLFMGSVNLNSKAFSVGGIPHVYAAYTYPSLVGSRGAVSIQPTNFLLNLYNLTPTMGGSTNNDVVANIAAKVSPDEANQSAPASGRLPGVRNPSSGVYELASLQNSNFTLEVEPYAPFLSPTGVMDCQFNFNLSNPDVQSLGNNALIAGGEVAMYDGVSAVEQNFHIYPNILAGAVISTSGGSMGNASEDTVYGYIYLYEWIDNQGQVHRSFPSPDLTPLAPGQDYTFASGTTTGSITLTVPNLRVTNKGGSQVVINIYRTIGNGSVYFLTGTGAYGTLINDPSTDSQTYVDTFADVSIEGNTQIYTTGALGYYAPPATNALTNFKNRAIAVASEDPYQFGYSNAVLQNFPVQFVPEFLQNIGTVGGPLVAIAQMDDKMILFKSGKVAGPSIYYMVGQGPAASGANNDFQDPLPIAVSVGNVDRASVVLTDDGLLFKSDKGIFLLNRGLQAEYIGAAVEGYNQYSVLSSQLIPNSTQVRFWLSNGTLLMYDYFYKKWATWTPPAGISDCIFQGQHTYVSASGQVYQETPGVYVDGTNTPVQMSFTTAWLEMAGLQGYERMYFFYFIGQFLSAHQLTLSLSYDFETAPSQTAVVTPLNSASGSLEQWKIHLQRQTAQAIQLAVTETDSAGGPGLAISGLNFMVNVKKGYRPVPAAQTTG